MSLDLRVYLVTDPSYPGLPALASAAVARRRHLPAGQGQAGAPC